MVSLVNVSAVNKFERISQSADYAIRSLLVAADDPLALASYLWVYRQHDLTSINSNALVRWGDNWVRRTFVERQTSSRQDEEVASAALVVAALSKTSKLSKLKQDIRAGLSEVLNTELDKRAIPFKRISYGAIALLGACSIGIDDSRLLSSIKDVINQYKEAITGGRVYGLPYAALLARLKADSNTEELGKKIKESLNNPRVSWEDQAYLLQSLWFLQRGQTPCKDLLKLTEQYLLKSPVWGYLMNGDEDMPPAGDGIIAVRVSHLYRAALLDILTRFQATQDLREEIQFHERYQGRKGVGLSAFGFYILLLMAAWFFLLRFMIPITSSGLRFWFKHEYASMSRGQAIVFLIGTIATMCLAHLTLEMVPALYSVLVRLNIQSDQRAWDVLWPRLRRILKLWLIIVGLGSLVMGIIVNVISPGAERIINQ